MRLRIIVPSRRGRGLRRGGRLRGMWVVRCGCCRNRARLNRDVYIGSVARSGLKPAGGMVVRLRVITSSRRPEMGGDCGFTDAMHNEVSGIYMACSRDSDVPQSVTWMALQALCWCVFVRDRGS